MGCGASVEQPADGSAPVKSPSAAPPKVEYDDSENGHKPIADKIATLAAYRVLGTEAAPAQEVRTAMRETSTRNCINMAQLNLQQCVAAAHNQFEVPFCIGEHALTDVGDCIGDITQ